MKLKVTFITAAPYNAEVVEYFVVGAAGADYNLRALALGWTIAKVEEVA